MFGFFKRKSRTPEPGSESAPDPQQVTAPPAVPPGITPAAAEPDTGPAVDVEKRPAESPDADAASNDAASTTQELEDRTGASESASWFTRLKSSVGLGGREPTPAAVPESSPEPQPPIIDEPPQKQTAAPEPVPVEPAPAPVEHVVPPAPPADRVLVPTPAPEEPVAPVVSAPEQPAPQGETGGWFSRLRQGLSKTRDQLGGQLVSVFGVGRKLDEAFYEELETVLLTSDVGVQATEFLIENLRSRARKGGYRDAFQLREALGDLLLEMLEPLEQPLDVAARKPFVIMLAGVNGSGKTTSIGKLAHYYGKQGRKVLLAAGDTFRAAAREQLVAWGERNNVTVVTSQSGDAAAVIFDAINAAAARGIDIVLADTAGRLPTQLHLMDEIRKVKRVVGKALPGAPHEVLLVLDANTGQNALAQVKAFDDALGVTGLVMTKLDGTAKGGVIAAIAHTRSKAAGRPIPLRFVGVGESLNDLRPFNAEDFVAALVGDDDNT